MKQTLKKIGAAATAAAAMPLAALAQIATPGGTGLPEASIGAIVTALMNWLLGIVGVVSVIAFAISGVMYLTAAGDEDRAGTAKKAMIMSIIGVIVALIGLIVFAAAQRFLGAGGGI